MNVEPHLQRCAAHARSEDEFMAAAARLLLNVRERQQWLATWATRRQVEGGTDTSPVELDSTVPGAFDVLPPHGWHLSPAQRAHLSDALVRELGPTGARLLASESQHSASVGELLARLNSHLDGEAQRARFRLAVSSLPQA